MGYSTTTLLVGGVAGAAVLYLLYETYASYQILSQLQATTLTGKLPSNP
jgi:hypothetical protein